MQQKVLLKDILIFLQEDGKLLFIILLAICATAYFSYYNGKQLGKFELCEELPQMSNAVNSAGDHVCINTLLVSAGKEIIEKHSDQRINYKQNLNVNYSYNKSLLKIESE